MVARARSVSKWRPSCAAPMWMVSFCWTSRARFFSHADLQKWKMTERQVGGCFLSHHHTPHTPPPCTHRHTCSLAAPTCCHSEEEVNAVCYTTHITPPTPRPRRRALWLKFLGSFGPRFWVDFQCQSFFICVFQISLKVRELLQINCPKFFEEHWLWVKFHGESEFSVGLRSPALFRLFSAVYCDFHNFQLHASKLHVCLEAKFLDNSDFWSNLVIGEFFGDFLRFFVGFRVSGEKKNSNQNGCQNFALKTTVAVGINNV
jgi:hypothetical protein